MKQIILTALRITLVSIVLFCGIYTMVIWLFAQFSPAKGEGETISVNGRTVGYSLEGQQFNQDQYFWGRPSAAGYNAAGSSGSNKGPGNPDFLKDIQSRIDSFLVHNPGTAKKDIPFELVSASGSGLDPDLSLEAAFIQVPRIAKARHQTIDRIKALVEKHFQQPLLLLLGPGRVNVLQLNADLDKLR